MTVMMMMMMMMCNSESGCDFSWFPTWDSPQICGYVNVLASSLGLAPYVHLLILFNMTLILFNMTLILFNMTLILFNMTVNRFDSKCLFNTCRLRTYVIPLIVFRRSEIAEDICNIRKFLKLTGMSFCWKVSQHGWLSGVWQVSAFKHPS